MDKTASQPELGDTRIVKKFALLPISVRGRWAWLRNVCILEIYGWDRYAMDHAWIRKRLLTKDEADAIMAQEAANKANKEREAAIKSTWPAGTRYRRERLRITFTVLEDHGASVRGVFGVYDVTDMVAMRKIDLLDGWSKIDDAEPYRLEVIRACIYGMSKKPLGATIDLEGLHRELGVARACLERHIREIRGTHSRDDQVIIAIAREIVRMADQVDEYTSFIDSRFVVTGIPGEHAGRE